MPKNIHEIRDPIHVFVRLDSEERKVLNSPPFQRLRHIHQLALTYLVYPGATHRRFEHSLGVMELASRVYDVITRPENVSSEVKDCLPEVENGDKKRYWKRVLRMAALCHDLGHLPFSHAAEKELLPDDWDHERLTREIIQSGEMNDIWKGITPPLNVEHIVKLAIGPRNSKDLTFSDWEAILSEIIVGEAFGVDRMDYLLRDSHHIGVAYGQFDHYRLIDTLRILPPPPEGSPAGDSSREPKLGVEEGGIHSAEALMLARYFMYSQVYFHHVRRIYDIHLRDFLEKWLEGGKFNTDISRHLALTDNEVNRAIFQASRDEGSPAHEDAIRIMNRRHFKLLYEKTPGHPPEAGEAVFNALVNKFGKPFFRHDFYMQTGSAPDFPVKMPDETVVSSLTHSDVLKHLPLVAVDYVFVERSRESEATRWLEDNLLSVLRVQEEKEEE